jgi:glycosyltransferase involved in cell wall biosynthesis
MPRILFLTAHPVDDPSCRYRVQQFVPSLEAAGYECTVSSFSTPTLFRSLRSKGSLLRKTSQTFYCAGRRALRLAALRRFDLIFIHREAFPFLTPAFEKAILARHPNVIFSFDDAIYAGHADVSNLNHPFLYRLKYGKGCDEIIRRSQHVVVGNTVLADYARRLNPRISVIPTVVDCQRYTVRRADFGERGPLTIGWMGSRSTVSYLSIVEPALRRISQIHGSKVQFRFFGFPGYKLDIPGFESLPFRLDSELQDLHSFDIGIMPLPDSEWTRGKCAFKAIQYMASGVPAIASPVGMATELIQHESNGLLAESTEQWTTGINRLITDTALRSRLALRGRRTVEENYSLQTWAPRFIALLDRLAGRKAFSGVETTPVLNR